jgi:NAD(P)-dependent dehydrogenase (short-subunit alcohol dehydrogenase family)
VSGEASGEPDLGSLPGRGLRLDGQRALVTGAGRGIGLACAEALAVAGARVTLLSRTRSELDQAADAIIAAGGQADVLICDCTDADAVTEVIGGAPDHWDVLVNNAGTNRPQPFLEVTREAFDAIMRINVTGAFFVAQTVAAKMAAGGTGGSIIHMSSQMGHVGGARRSVYCASKHAVEGMTKAMAIDLAPHRIRVNSVCPTYVVTPMTAPFFEDEAFLADTLGRIPIGRLAQVDDVTGAVVFLASDAAAMITGSAIKIDGGWTAI